MDTKLKKSKYNPIIKLVAVLLTIIFAFFTGVNALNYLRKAVFYADNTLGFKSTPTFAYELKNAVNNIYQFKDATEIYESDLSYEDYLKTDKAKEIIKSYNEKEERAVKLFNTIQDLKKLRPKTIETNNGTYNVDEKYQATQNSFLQSCVKVFADAPVTLLREHYRCHPRIIDFCNQRFYNGELIAMTLDSNEDKVLQVIKTVPGNHARGHFNQREIDVIIQEVMPDYSESESVGIITPYRDQAIAINRALGKDFASTVHKFQGRECDAIIMRRYYEKKNRIILIRMEK